MKKNNGGENPTRSSLRSVEEEPCSQQHKNTIIFDIEVLEARAGSAKKRSFEYVCINELQVRAP